MSAPDDFVPLRLLQVVHTLRGESGGPAESVRRSTEALLDLGHKVEIATLERPEDLPAGENLTVHSLGIQAGDIGYGTTPKLIPWLKAAQPRFDAVIIHGLWQFQGWGTHLALRGTKTPYLVFPHGMLDPWFRNEYPLKHYKKQLYWWLREGRVLARAAAVCFTCEEEQRLAKTTFFPYRVRERVVAFGTADPSSDPAGQHAAWAAHCPSAIERPYLLFLGRLHPKKNIETLLHAHGRWTAKDPAAPRLVIAGPGLESTYGKGLLHLAGQVCPAGSVLWPGMLTGPAKFGALRGCEAFVLASHQENFGISVAEALACGRPVLMSDKVNIWREIEIDNAGLVRGATPEEVVALLAAWSELNAEQREAMGRAARRSFETRFEIRHAAKSLAETVIAVVKNQA